MPHAAGLGWILRSPSSNHNVVPDMLCDPEQINYLLPAFIFPIVNQGMACLTYVPAGKCVSKTFKRHLQNYRAQKYCWKCPGHK